MSGVHLCQKLMGDKAQKRRTWPYSWISGFVNRINASTK